MTVYKLYLQSGPQRKKTEVRVLELLGCTTNGPTTEEALEATPEAIRDYLRFLKRHGEKVDVDQKIETEIALHNLDGLMNPALIFEPDEAPMRKEDVETYIERLTWMREDLLELIDGLSERELTEKPEPGRSIRRIVEHIYGSEYHYVRNFGKIDGVFGPGNVENLALPELFDRMEYVREKEIDHLRSLSEAKRIDPIVHKSYDNTPRQYFRFMVEHHWEHLNEIKDRLDATA
jgi:uncharacterized damage-inducible protein DinB/predicted RNase H-like HicB family nuclease